MFNRFPATWQLMCYLRFVCMIEGCEAKAAAKGLCPKHYMRQRRAGDPSRVRKSGRKKSELREAIGEIGQGWSPRTRQRFAAAVKMLREACDDGKVAELMKAATRPSGSLNVSKLQDMALMNWVVRSL